MKEYDQYKDSGISWIGQMPEHWEMKRTAIMFTENRTKNSKYEFKHALKFNYGSLVLKNEQGDISEFRETYEAYTIINEDDIAINCLNLNYDFVSQRVAVSPQKGILTSAYLIMSARHGVNPYFFTYLFKAMDSMKLFHGMGTGIRLTLSYNELKKQKLPVPPLSEQHAIVTYLDIEVNKIDRYIATAEKKIVALNELKQVTIADAVTHGIHPNVPMKDSGIRWIGQVPEHWSRLRFKEILKVKDERVGARKDLTLLSLTKNGVIVRDLSEGKGKFPKDFESYKIVHPNDLILCLFDVDETPRTVGIAHNYGMITGAYDIFQVQNVVLTYIYYFYLSLDDSKCLKPLYKGLRKVIPLPNLMGSNIFLPPKKEQEEIVSYIDCKVAQIDKMRNAELTQIEKLKEYKQRLISDVVTGKVKV